MSLLDTVLIAAASWNDATPSTIQNCFKHAGFVRWSSEVGLGHQEGEEQSLPSDEENEVWNLFERFAEVTHVNPAITVQDFISMDETIGTSQEIFCS
ncbi:hypothetical protein RRG08_038118 [Elysia crispata]|uniref:Uncharacterized protein n=1 Tax=Elysia crispata TaxID=231223 RepID=A0AAE1DPH0_9GAST|nr:hypothetical protein RRG08_038118 [Elysia crispata]